MYGVPDRYYNGHTDEVSWQSVEEGGLVYKGRKGVVNITVTKTEGSSKDGWQNGIV